MYVYTIVLASEEILPIFYSLRVWEGRGNILGLVALLSQLSNPVHFWMYVPYGCLHLNNVPRPSKTGTK
jgi:hypothetical protein